MPLTEARREFLEKRTEQLRPLSCLGSVKSAEGFPTRCELEDEEWITDG